MLYFNSANYNGPVHKTITVASNHKGQPVTVLHLNGTIWKPIEFIPPYTVMNVPPDATNATAIVRVINNTDGPVTLTDPQSSLPAFAVELSTNKPGKEFQLRICAVDRLKPGSTAGRVTLKCSLTNQPTVDVSFWANVQAPVLVMPAQVMLPSAPLTNKLNSNVTIQNNTTNLVTVSDAAVDLPGVEVQIKQLQSNRLYSVQLSFPPGFQLPQGQKGTLRLKSSHPQYASIQVPIIQMARATTPPPRPNLGPGAPRSLAPAAASSMLPPRPAQPFATNMPIALQRRGESTNSPRISFTLPPVTNLSSQAIR
jgi:hypothetical protein